MSIDDEDELLYGESSLPFTSLEDTDEQQKTNRYVSTTLTHLKKLEIIGPCLAKFMECPGFIV